jgi:hypothetical protein
LFKTPHVAPILSEPRRQELQCKLAFELCIESQKDLTHPPGAKLREDAVMPYSLADHFRKTQPRISESNNMSQVFGRHDFSLRDSLR